jgi:LuxR family maltose regulon positive regulatory protein
VPKAAYTPLLRTKITLPPAVRTSWRGAGCSIGLHAGLVRPLTVVAAPAGFGKTTLVVNWLHELASPTAVAMAVARRGRRRDEPLPLLPSSRRYRRSRPRWAARRSRCWEASGCPAPKDLVTLLLNEIGESEQPIVLALDDYHLIGNPEVDAAVEFLVERMPEKLHLALVTRDQPDLPLARWRALGRVNEIGLDDLRFLV